MGLGGTQTSDESRPVCRDRSTCRHRPVRGHASGACLTLLPVARLGQDLRPIGRSMKRVLQFGTGRFLRGFVDAFIDDDERCAGGRPQPWSPGHRGGEHRLGDGSATRRPGLRLSAQDPRTRAGQDRGHRARRSASSIASSTRPRTRPPSPKRPSTRPRPRGLEHHAGRLRAGRVPEPAGRRPRGTRPRWDAGPAHRSLRARRTQRRPPARAGPRRGGAVCGRSPPWSSTSGRPTPGRRASSTASRRHGRAGRPARPILLPWPWSRSRRGSWRPPTRSRCWTIPP